MLEGLESQCEEGEEAWKASGEERRPWIEIKT